MAGIVKDRVYFPQEVVVKLESLKPKPVVSPAPVNQRNVSYFPQHHNLTDEERKARDEHIQAVLIECRIEGYDVGAIVVPKFQNRQACYMPTNWGVVVSHATWGATIQDYKPLEVQWLNRSKINSKERMEDVYLIHSAADQGAMEMLFDIQDELERRDE